MDSEEWGSLIGYCIVGLIILFVSSEALGMGNPFAGGCLAWLFD